MCFSISDKFSKAKIATQDILVVKKGRIKNEDTFRENDKVFISSIRVYEYKQNKLQPKIRLKMIDEGAIYRGYHAYWKYYITRIDNLLFLYGDTYHKLGLFKIPKGSRYYINRYDSLNCEIVSNQMVYLRLLKISDLTPAKDKFITNLNVHKLKYTTL